MTHDEIVEVMARALAKDFGLDFDEVCGVDADPDEGYCDSSTCVASGYEEHDAAYARRVFRSQATAALSALDQAGLQIVGGEPVAWYYHHHSHQPKRPPSEVSFARNEGQLGEGWTETPLFAGKVLT